MKRVEGGFYVPNDLLGQVPRRRCPATPGSVDGDESHPTSLSCGLEAKRLKPTPGRSVEEQGGPTFPWSDKGGRDRP